MAEQAQEVVVTTATVLVVLEPVASFERALQPRVQLEADVTLTLSPVSA